MLGNEMAVVALYVGGTIVGAIIGSVIGFRWHTRRQHSN